MISTPHSLQPDTRETSHSKLKEPSEEFKMVLPCSPDETGGRRSGWHRHCWTAASSDRHDGPQPQKTGKESCVSSPRCELLPQKTGFTLLSGFLAACAEACCQEQRGAWSGAGSRPFPGLPCQDCSSQTAPHPQHSKVMPFPPHISNKPVSAHGEMCLQSSQVVFKYGTQKHNSQQPSWARNITSASLVSLRNKAVLPHEKFKSDKLLLVPQIPPALFPSLGLRGKWKLCAVLRQLSLC